MRAGRQHLAQPRGQPALRLVPSSNNSFFLRKADVVVTFEQAGADGKSPSFMLKQNGREMKWVRVELATPTPSRMAAYSGTYFSQELNTLYFVSARDGQLFVRHPRGEIELLPLEVDSFAATYPLGHVRFTCSDPARCDSFRVSNGRVQNLRFHKVELGEKKE